MATTVGNENELNDLLKHLIRLDYDAAEAYAAAVDRLNSTTFKNTLSLFREDHLRHTRELGQILSARGESPPDGPGGKRFLTKGKVVIANLFGDTAVLHAMLSNESDTNTAYERAVKNPVADDEVRKVLQRNLEDERKHKHWIEDAIRTQKAA